MSQLQNKKQKTVESNKIITDMINKHLTKDNTKNKRNNNAQRALVLQGGGALAAYEVGVGFDHHKTGAEWYTWVLRCGTSGEAGDGQIKGSPEKVYGGDLTCEATTKFRKYLANLQENAPEPVCTFRIIGRMFLILLKRGSIRHFNRSGPDGYRHTKR